MDATVNARVVPIISGTGPQDLAPGNALVAGMRLREFEIIETLGEGGFSIVYGARDLQLMRDVAIKEYIPISLAGRVASTTVRIRSEHNRETFEAGLNGFINEARLLAQFKHPGLVEVLQFWEENGTAYMVMPRYTGKTLRSVLKEMGGKGDEPWLRGIVAPVLDVLDLLHSRNVFHRDIAPDNILIKNDGTPVLLDLGSAREVVTGLQKAITVVVKPGYAPIEQYSSDFALPQGPWTDVYAVGALLHFAILGSPPPASISRIMKDSLQPLASAGLSGYSREFLTAVDRALALQPSDRPQSIAELRALLRVTEHDRTVISLAPPPQIPPAIIASAPATAPAPEIIEPVALDIDLPGSEDERTVIVSAQEVAALVQQLAGAKAAAELRSTAAAAVPARDDQTAAPVEPVALDVDADIVPIASLVVAAHAAAEAAAVDTPRADPADGVDAAVISASTAPLQVPSPDVALPPEITPSPETAPTVGMAPPHDLASPAMALSPEVRLPPEPAATETPSPATLTAPSPVLTTAPPATTELPPPFMLEPLTDAPVVAAMPAPGPPVVAPADADATVGTSTPSATAPVLPSTFELALEPMDRPEPPVVAPEPIVVSESRLEPVSLPPPAREPEDDATVAMPLPRQIAELAKTGAKPPAAAAKPSAASDATVVMQAPEALALARSVAAAAPPPVAANANEPTVILPSPVALAKPAPSALELDPLAMPSRHEKPASNSFPEMEDLLSGRLAAESRPVAVPARAAANEKPPAPPTAATPARAPSKPWLIPVAIAAAVFVVAASLIGWYIASTSGEPVVPPPIVAETPAAPAAAPQDGQAPVAAETSPAAIDPSVPLTSDANAIPALPEAGALPPETASLPAGGDGAQPHEVLTPLAAPSETTSASFESPGQTIAPAVTAPPPAEIPAATAPAVTASVPASADTVRTVDLTAATSPRGDDTDSRPRGGNLRDTTSRNTRPKTVAVAKSGNVKLSIQPWGEVWINGSLKGVSPPMRFLQLEPGTYNVELRNPGLQSMRRQLVVTAGQAAAIEHRFQPSGGGAAQ